MARQRAEKNISYDAKRKLYYVTLYYGNVDGKPQKETETFSTKREAREVISYPSLQLDNRTELFPKKR